MISLKLKITGLIFTLITALSLITTASSSIFHELDTSEDLYFLSQYHEGNPKKGRRRITKTKKVKKSTVNGVNFYTYYYFDDDDNRNPNSPPPGFSPPNLSDDIFLGFPPGGGGINPVRRTPSPTQAPRRFQGSGIFTTTILLVAFILVSIVLVLGVLALVSRFARVPTTSPRPSRKPSFKPSLRPSLRPSRKPSSRPSRFPSADSRRELRSSPIHKKKAIHSKNLFNEWDIPPNRTSSKIKQLLQVFVF